MIKTSLGKIRYFLANEDGPTAIEYMVMVSVIVIVCLVTINTIGLITSDSITNSSNAITDAIEP